MILSVVLAVYNDEKFLHKAIESILNQTFKDFELIIVDDGSKDRSGEIADAYARKDSRIKVIHQENKCVAEARNAGIAIAKGKYISIHDSDDISLPERFATQLTKMEGDNLDLIASGCYFIVENENIIAESKNNQEIVKNLKAGRNPLIHGTVIMRTDLLRKVGCYDPFYIACEDFVIWLKFIEKGYRISKIDVPLYKYRLRNNSAGQRFVSRHYFYRGYENYLKRLKNLPEDFTPILNDGKKIKYSYQKKVANAIFWSEDYKRYRKYYFENFFYLFDEKEFHKYLVYSLLPVKVKNLLKNLYKKVRLNNISSSS